MQYCINRIHSYKAVFICKLILFYAATGKLLDCHSGNILKKDSHESFTLHHVLSERQKHKEKVHMLKVKLFLLHTCSLAAI